MPKDLIGQRFGRWTVISRAEDQVCKDGYRNVMWNCRCDCGNEKAVRAKTLVSGQSKSCGCLQKELTSERAQKHGGFGTRLYHVWNSMRQRCNNPNSQAYHNYGGRGITICPEWDDYNVFREWAVGAGYDESAKRGEYTLDRIDVNKGYCPENCRFVNMHEQVNNRRNTIFVECDGDKYSLSEWAEIKGVNYYTLFQRYKQGVPLFA